MNDRSVNKFKSRAQMYALRACEPPSPLKLTACSRPCVACAAAMLNSRPSSSLFTVSKAKKSNEFRTKTSKFQCPRASDCTVQWNSDVGVVHSTFVRRKNGTKRRRRDLAQWPGTALRPSLLLSIEKYRGKMVCGAMHFELCAALILSGVNFSKYPPNLYMQVVPTLLVIFPRHSLLCQLLYSSQKSPIKHKSNAEIRRKNRLSFVHNFHND